MGARALMPPASCSVVGERRRGAMWAGPRGRMRWASVIVAFVLALPGVTHASPWAVSSVSRLGDRPSSSANAEALLAQADAARTEARWADAARLFTSAYDELPTAMLADLGETTVALAIDAHNNDAAQSGSTAPLRAARDLIARLESDLAALPKPRPLPAALEKTKSELDAKLATSDSTDPAGGDPGVEGPPPAPPVDRKATRRAVDRDVTSWVLVGTGGAAVVAGVATLVWGSRILPIAKDRLDDRGRDLIDPARDAAYLDENRRRGRITMGAGGVIAVVGVSLLAWGIVRLVRKRQKGGD